MAKQQDNLTGFYKAALRRKAMKFLDKQPVIFETHGGLGELYTQCYQSVPRGYVVEKQEAKATVLSEQRPGWYVYQGEAEDAIAVGVGGTEEINFLDVDPYGSPWPVLELWFALSRERAGRLIVVANDGLLQKIRIGGAASCKDTAEYASEYGSVASRKYLEICKKKLQKIAPEAGYDLTHFEGYHCGRGKSMTHYLAVLDK